MKQINNQGNSIALIFQNENLPIQNQYSESFSCTNLSSVALEISDATTCEVKVQGCVYDKDSDGKLLADNDCQWTTLGLINASDFSVLDEAGEDGIYYLSLSGIQRVRLDIGSTTTTAKIIMVSGE